MFLSVRDCIEANSFYSIMQSSFVVLSTAEKCFNHVQCKRAIWSENWTNMSVSSRVILVLILIQAAQRKTYLLKPIISNIKLVVLNYSDIYFAVMTL